MKSLRTDGHTDDERQAIRKAHLSLRLRWAKKGIRFEGVSWCTMQPFKASCTKLQLLPNIVVEKYFVILNFTSFLVFQDAFQCFEHWQKKKIFGIFFLFLSVLNFFEQNIDSYFSHRTLRKRVSWSDLPNSFSAIH